MNAEGEREMYDDRCGVETGGEIQGGFGEENGPINIRRGKHIGAMEEGGEPTTQTSYKIEVILPMGDGSPWHRHQPCLERNRHRASLAGRETIAMTPPSRRFAAVSLRAMQRQRSFPV